MGPDVHREEYGEYRQLPEDDDPYALLPGKVPTRGRVPPDAPGVDRCRQFSAFSVFMTVRAALRPGSPLMPAIGWVPDPDRNRPGTGVL